MATIPAAVFAGLIYLALFALVAVFGYEIYALLSEHGVLDDITS